MQCVLVCEFGAEKEPTVEVSKDCTSWFDGCNTCLVTDGVIGGCTKMMCNPDLLEEPKCLQFK